MKRFLLIVLFFQVFNSCDDVHIKNRSSSYANKTEKTLPELCSPLLNTYWHQYEPFNKYMTVLIEEKHAVAGCTIIALAQLLNYHKFFNNKNYYFGALNSYLNSMETNHPKDTTGSMYVSEFIKDISTNETLDTYLKWHSSVYVYIKSIPKFLNKVGYDAHIGKFNFDKIKKYLSRGNPVIMTAETIEGHSHVWVVDGYRDYHKKGLSNDHYSYLHMNWGWGVNYQNGEKDNGWHKVDKNGLVTYGNLILDQKVKTIYINR